MVRRWLASGALHQLTELVRFEEAVDHALSESVSRYSFLLARARDVLVGILAHDLHTPLGAIAMARPERGSALAARPSGCSASGDAELKHV